MRFCFLMAALLASTLAMGQTLDRIAAIVNEDVVLLSEWQARMDNLRQQAAGQSLPSNIGSQVLDQLILESMQVQAAQQRGLRIEQSQLENALNNIASRNGMSLSQFSQRLGDDFAPLREQVRRQLLIQRLQQQVISQEVTVGEREIDAYLASLAGQASLPRRYLLLYTRAETEEQAAQIRAQVQAGKNLNQLELDDVRDLGWRETEQLPTLFASLVPGLQAGEISQAVASGGAWHLVQLMDIEDLIGQQSQEYLSRHILIRADIRSAQEAESLARQLQTELENGQDFAELARLYSEDGSSEQGGLLPWSQAAGWVPEFAEQVQALTPGERSDAFESRFGWHLVQLDETRQASTNRDQLRQQVRQSLGEQKTQQALDQWLMELRSQAFIDIKDF